MIVYKDNVSHLMKEEFFKLKLRNVEVSRHLKNQVVADYVIGDSIGCGTYGKVFVSEHRTTKQQAAIKIIEKRRVRDRSDIESLEKEIEALKLVDHPYIIQLYEVYESISNIYIVMEYANYGNLHDYITNKIKINEKEACSLFSMILLSINYCHTNNIIHRDIKPENILLDKLYNNNHLNLLNNLVIKLTDFGLCTFSSDKLLKTSCGSPCYTAPELLCCKQYNGPLADIWSLGILLYTMVTGNLPFNNDNPKIVYNLAKTNNYVRPSFISSSCMSLIENILKFNPNDRLSLEQISKHNWMIQISDSTTNIDQLSVLPFDANSAINTEIINMLQFLNFNTNTVIRELTSKVYNNNTSTYKLIKKKILYGYNKSFTLPKISSNSSNLTEVLFEKDDSHPKESPTSIIPPLSSITKNMKTERSQSPTGYISYNRSKLLSIDINPRNPLKQSSISSLSRPLDLSVYPEGEVIHLKKCKLLSLNGMIFLYVDISLERAIQFIYRYLLSLSLQIKKTGPNTFCFTTKSTDIEVVVDLNTSRLKEAISYRFFRVLGNINEYTTFIHGFLGRINDFL